MPPRANSIKAEPQPVAEDPVERILHANPIRRIWRISYLIQCFADPFYTNIERHHGLSRLEVVTLHCLAQFGPLRAQQIVEMLVRPKNTVSGAVHSLLRRRLIVRQRDPEDRRQAILTLTRAGRDVYEALLPSLVERERKLLEPLTKREVAELDRLLSKLVEHVPQWRFDE